jgi:hypothetical protein
MMDLRLQMPKLFVTNYMGTLKSHHLPKVKLVYLPISIFGSMMLNVLDQNKIL